MHNAESWKIIEQWVAAEPNLFGPRQAEADQWLVDCAIARVREDPSAAEHALLRCVELAERLARDFPAEPYAWYLLSNRQRDFVEYLTAANRNNDARSHLARAIETARRNVESGHPRSIYLSDLAGCLVFHPELGLSVPEEAVELAKRAVEQAASPSPRCLLVLAKAQQANGDCAAATKTVQQALALLAHGPSETRSVFETIMRECGNAQRN